MREEEAACRDSQLHARLSEHLKRESYTKPTQHLCGDGAAPLESQTEAQSRGPEADCGRGGQRCGHAGQRSKRSG